MPTWKNASPRKRVLKRSFLIFISACGFESVYAFTVKPIGSSITVPHRTSSSSSQLFYNSRADSDDFDGPTLERRLMEIRVRTMEQEFVRPPNPSLSPHEFIERILLALWNNSEPLPESGFRTLLRASTKDWRRKMYDAVAAPSTANEEAVASAVGEAMARPRNQFAILVGEEEHYISTFPTDELDYDDGTCWLECRLRDKKDDRLLVVLGWQLERRSSDGAWLVASIDWQDFRGKILGPLCGMLVAERHLTPSQIRIVLG